MNFIGAMDLIVLPSVGYEDFPNVVLEAMRLGKPVIASRIAGTPEQVIDEVTGLLVPPGAPADLSAAIHRVAKDPALQKAWGHAGAARRVGGGVGVESVAAGAGWLWAKGALDFGGGRDLLIAGVQHRTRAADRRAGGVDELHGGPHFLQCSVQRGGHARNFRAAVQVGGETLTIAATTVVLAAVMERAAGLSRNKTLAVKDIAAQTLAGVVPDSRAIKKLANEEILERLNELNSPSFIASH